VRTLGFDKPLYILPFDHRGSFQKKIFGWSGTLSSEQTAEITPTKQVADFFLEEFVAAGFDSFLVHFEGNVNLHPTVQRIKALGKRAGVVINPQLPRPFWTVY
jgi:hypothetical protein